ncbi:MAG: hypothetical protein RBT34_00860, partial [Anaerolineaceae bacterium]|nr:hypothetical protein [Anaerolineaceae bacterium]
MTAKTDLSSVIVSLYEKQAPVKPGLILFFLPSYLTVLKKRAKKDDRQKTPVQWVCSQPKRRS